MKEVGERKLLLRYCMSTDPYTTTLPFKGWDASTKLGLVLLYMSQLVRSYLAA